MFLLCFWLFHEVRVIHALKPLAWKSRDFLTDPLIEISIHRNFYPSSFNLTFETDPSQLQLYVQGVGFSPQYSYWVRRFFIDNLSIYDFVNDLSVFLLSFSTGLEGFSSIDLAGFPSQFSYWVRRFFTKLRIKLHSYPYTFDGAHV